MSGAVLLFLKSHWPAVAIAAAILLFLAWLIHASYSRGAADTENEHREGTINQLQERNGTDEDVRTMDDAGVCRAIGGRLRDGRC